MKTLFPIILLFLTISTFLSAQDMETRALPFFNKINYEGHGSIFLEPADKAEIKIQDSEQYSAAHVRAEVRDETLYIWYDFESGSITPLDHQRVDIYVHYPELEALNLNGEIRVDAIHPITGDHFELTAEGKIDLRLPLEVQHFDATLAGEMSVNFSGKVTHENISFEGRGSVNTMELYAQSADITTDGMGHLYLPYIESMNAVATGTSEIKYTKNAACKVGATKKGLGKIVVKEQRM